MLNLYMLLSLSFIVKGFTANLNPADKFVITHRDKFYELFDDKSRYLIVALLKRNCTYSQDLLENLNIAIDRLKQIHSDLKIIVAGYYCENSNFCKKYFNCSDYPELRFYNRPSDPTQEFVRFERPRRYEADKLAKKIYKRIYPVKTFTDIKFIDEEFINRMKKKAREKKSKTLYYCVDHMTEKDLKIMKEVLGLFLDIYAVQLENCHTEVETSDKYINKLQKYNKKAILLVKYGHSESAVYEKRILRHELFNFIQTNREVRIHKLTTERVNALFAKQEIAFVLFIKPCQQSLIKVLKKFATKIISKTMMKFYYFIVEQNSESNTAKDPSAEGANYLRQILGVAVGDTPAIRIIRIRANNNHTKYRMDSQEIDTQTLRAFYDSYINGELDVYNKRDLSLREIDSNLLPRYLKPFDERLTKKNFKSEKYVFILVLGDEQNCHNCLTAVSDFSLTISSFLKLHPHMLKSIEFRIVDIFREELDRFVHGSFPSIIQINTGKGKMSKRISSYAYSQEKITDAIKAILNGMNIHSNSVSVDLGIIEVIDREL